MASRPTLGPIDKFLASSSRPTAPRTTEPDTQNGKLSVIVAPNHINTERENRVAPNYINTEREIRIEEGMQSSSSFSATATDKTKMCWTPAEDRLLMELVKQHGESHWAMIVPQLVGRTGKQCRERYLGYLHPDIKKEEWTEEEERTLVEAHKKLGNRWAEIAKLIPGRSENSIKNYWFATLRKKKPKQTILSEYMKTCKDTLPMSP